MFIDIKPLWLRSTQWPAPALPRPVERGALRSTSRVRRLDPSSASTRPCWDYNLPTASASMARTNNTGNAHTAHVCVFIFFKVSRNPSIQSFLLLKTLQTTYFEIGRGHRVISHKLSMSHSALSMCAYSNILKLQCLNRD